MTEARALKTLTQIGRILRLCELGQVRAESALHAVQQIAAITQPEADPKNHAMIERIAKASEDPAANDVKALVLMAKTNADEDWEGWTKVQPKFSDPPHCQ